jgi:Xaa-Pro aminopeptidase
MERIHKLQKLIKDSYAALVDHPINLFYLTGLDLSAGRLVVTQDQCFLIADGRYYESCKQKCSFPVLLLKENVLKDLFFAQLDKVDKVIFDEENTTYHEYTQLKKILDPLEIVLEPSQDLVAQLRRIKDSHELVKLEKAGVLGSAGFDYVCSILKEGISEEEVAAQLEIFWRQHGGKGVAFDPIIAFGANGSMPHYRAGKDRLKHGQPVLIDIGVTLDHYHSDMTRTVFIGEPPPKIKEIYAIVLEAQKRAIASCKPGITVGHLDATARDYITEKGYGDFFTHSLGHGIGLDVHEFPILRNKPPMQSVVLEPGMVITIEPGIYVPGEGGVRIEDTVVVTPSGCKDLTNRPK